VINGIKYSRFSKHLYAFQKSDIIVIPGNIYSLMTFINVSFHLFRTGTMNIRPLFLSNPPKIHFSSISCPLLYFRFPIFASSISTIISLSLIFLKCDSTQ